MDAQFDTRETALRSEDSASRQTTFDDALRSEDSGSRQNPRDPRIVLVHDWLTGMRGGEKCLEPLCRFFPEALL